MYWRGSGDRSAFGPVLPRAAPLLNTRRRDRRGQGRKLHRFRTNFFEKKTSMDV
jgi:hypothetical protein